MVYLYEIGSMYRQPSSGRTSTTRPWIAAIRYGLAASATDKATRGSRRMSLAFQIASEVQARGELRGDADPERLATATMASLQGGLLLSQVRRDPGQLRAALDAALAYLYQHHPQ